MVGGIIGAAVGVLVELPVAVALDVATAGGVLADKDKPYTTETLQRINENLEGK